MQEKKDGSMYAPKGKAEKVVEKGRFKVGVIGMDHGHIYGMCNGLTEAGAEIVLVYDNDPKKVTAFCEQFKEAKVAESEEEVLSSDVNMIASASIASLRAELGIQAMLRGKHFFADKPSITSLENIEKVRATCRATGKRFFTYFSERLHVEASVFAERLIKEGKIGRVVNIMGWGPHRVGKVENRPAWFWEENEYGGTLTDIGCHQIEQLFFYSGATDGKIVSSRKANYNHKDHSHFQDFGDATVEFNNGVTGYFRVDWFTPNGLGAWGDGRTLIVGTKGYIEIRKYIDIANDPEGDQVYYVDNEGEHHFTAAGLAGYPFFGKMILDCINGTDTAMNQDYILRVMELAITAQQNAREIEK